MGKKTGIALTLVILITVMILQNQTPTDFSFVVLSATLPKMVMMTAMAVGGIIVGVLIASPKKSSNEAVDQSNIQERYKNSSDTLSDEDRDYISEP